MNGINCPKCGAINPPNSAFCGACGVSLSQQSAPPPPTEPGWQQVPPPSDQSQSGAWQQTGSTSQWQQPGGIPPAGAPPSAGYQPLPPGDAYPAQFEGQKVTGSNTKWALGLGIAGIFCCGPFTAIPGIFMAKKDMDDIAAGRAPHLNDGMAKAAYYVNIAAVVLFVVGLCFWFGIGGLHRF